MSISTAAWEWPQWALLVWMIIGLLVVASEHGNPMVEPKTKEPKKHNAFVGIIKSALLLFILTAGGFFK